MERRWGRPADPTPFEITIATAIIRLGWSEAEHRLRAGLSRRLWWKPPAGRLKKDRFFYGDTVTHGESP